jgi:hypothetical protein
MNIEETRIKAAKVQADFDKPISFKTNLSVKEHYENYERRINIQKSLFVRALNLLCKLSTLCLVICPLCGMNPPAKPFGM